MSLIGLLVLVCVICLILWLVGQLPIEAKYLNIIRVVVIVICIVYVLEAAGMFAGPSLRLR